LWLGEAYLLTEDEKYAQEVISQIDNWIDENPLMHSINWTCAMDVAIRAVNWLFSLNMIIESDCINDSFAQKIYRSLFEHLFFINNNLEKQFPYSANHYASDIAGLIYLSAFYKDDSRYAQKSWQFSVAEFYQEVRTQVLPSGVHFEKSISYHRLMTEMFAYSYLFVLRNNTHIPKDIRPRICSMISFVSFYTMDSGFSPLIGDNDDGRLLPFYRYNFRDHHYIFACGIESYFLGTELEYIIAESARQISSISIYKDAGFAILRNQNIYLFVSNSGLSRYTECAGKEYGTHSHNDLLSFVLSIGKTEFITDPGAYVYTSLPYKRNEFCSTAKHNTIIVDGIEQNLLSSKNLFTVRQDASIEFFSAEETSTEISCCGSYTLEADETKLRHERKYIIAKEKNQISISDHLTFKGNHKATFYIHFAESVMPVIEDGIIIFEKEEKRLILSFEANYYYNVEILDDTISPSYGVLINSKTIGVSINFVDCLNFVASFCFF